jgi:hypothetical protein
MLRTEYLELCLVKEGLLERTVLSISESKGLSLLLDLYSTAFCTRVNYKALEQLKILEYYKP